jgi:hypothetical protein
VGHGRRLTRQRAQGAKITVEVLAPIDLGERFGPEPDHEQVYEEVTADMQDALSELQDERTMPVVG